MFTFYNNKKIEEKKIRIDSFEGTLLMDLLAAQQLTAHGNNQ